MGTRQWYSQHGYPEHGDLTHKNGAATELGAAFGPLHPAGNRALSGLLASQTPRSGPEGQPGFGRVAGNRAVSGLLARQPVGPMIDTKPGALELPPSGFGGWPGLDPAAGDAAPGADGAPAGPVAPVTGEATKGAEAEGAEQPAHASWMRLDSSQGYLPGDIVPGVTDVARPYTEADRKAMRTALDRRILQNKPRALELTDNFPEAVLHVWTRYVTEAMSDAAKPDEGWPWYAKLLSFAVRAALIAVFPEELMIEAVGHIGATLAEKGAEFGLEQASEKIGEHATEKATDSKLEKEAAKLERLSVTSASLITGALRPVVTMLAESTDYELWLTQAPVGELGLFRVPPLIPKINPAQIRTAVAQTLVGVVHDEESVAVEGRGDHEYWNKFGFSDKDNMVAAALHVVGPGKAAGGASFHGAAAFGAELQGASIKDLPQVPLFIELTASMGQLLGPVAVDMALIGDIAAAYSSKSPTLIKRYSDGTIAVDDGGLAEHLHLYERANPDQDVEELILEYVKGANAPVSPERTPAVIAKELSALLDPFVLVQGATFFILDSVGGLQVGK